MEKNILDASANDLMALAITFSAYMGNTYSADDLAILSSFFSLIGDSLGLYSAAISKQISNTNDCENAKKQ